MTRVQDEVVAGAPRRTSSTAGRANNGTRWWHMWLMYPTFAVTLVTAAPGIIDRVTAIYQDQTKQQFLYAEQQRKFWEENGLCVTTSYDPADFADDRGNVSALLCPTKDIAVVFIDETTQLPVYAGIEMDFLRSKLPFKEASASSVFGLAAHAATQVSAEVQPRDLAADTGPGNQFAQNAAVVCQQMQGDGRTLLRHINNGAGACFDEYVDTFTGMVTSVQQVPCRQSCG